MLKMVWVRRHGGSVAMKCQVCGSESVMPFCSRKCNIAAMRGEVSDRKHRELRDRAFARQQERNERELQQLQTELRRLLGG